LYGWKGNSMLTNCLAACAHLTITVSEIERDIGRKSLIFHTPFYSTPPLGKFLSEYRHPLWYGKTRMVSLPDGEKISKISLFVLAQLTNVTDAQTDGHLVTAYTALMHMHRAVKTVCAYLQCCHLANENKTCPCLLVFKNNNMARVSQGFVRRSSRNAALVYSRATICA